MVSEGQFDVDEDTEIPDRRRSYLNRGIVEKERMLLVFVTQMKN
jgi:hypothetical protein